jgi:hypothetical protein
MNSEYQGEYDENNGVFRTIEAATGRVNEEDAVVIKIDDWLLTYFAGVSVYYIAHWPCPARTERKAITTITMDYTWMVAAVCDRDKTCGECGATVPDEMIFSYKMGIK